MGYACPVCGDPQADAEHLANHIAFTAMLGNDRHEAWLDEHAPDWETAGPEELAERVVEHAETVEFPRVFENTVEEGAPGAAPGDAPQGETGDAIGDAIGDDTGVDGGAAREPEPAGGMASTPPRISGDEDPQTRGVLREARELTRRMYDETGPDPDDSDETEDSTDSVH